MEKAKRSAIKAPEQTRQLAERLGMFTGFGHECSGGCELIVFGDTRPVRMDMLNNGGTWDARQKAFAFASWTAAHTALKAAERAFHRNGWQFHILTGVETTYS